MSIKNILQDMKDEIGNISRRRFDMKLGRGSRSQRVVQDSSVVAIDALRQSCWANMPPELLQDVLMRIEQSENSWPPRKHVVACAGVCKSWRQIMKDIVKTPQLSAKVTFPISLKQPGPKYSLIQCYIKRDSSSQTYYLFLGLNSVSYDDGKFLLAARRSRHPTCTDYIISLNPGYVAKGTSCYIGKLRSNFLGTKFTIYDSQPPKGAPFISKCRSTRLVGFKQVAPKFPTGNYPIAHISYELNVLGSRGPRRMQCIMDSIPASSMDPEGEAPTPTEFVASSTESSPSVSFFRSKSTRSDIPQSSNAPPPPKDETLVMRNKTPRWHEQLQCWCLNFNGRVTVASVKNFQLVAFSENGTEHDKVILQFGKVGKDIFTMDYGYPISAFQAFAICLSSFDTKIACE